RDQELEEARAQAEARVRVQVEARVRVQAEARVRAQAEARVRAQAEVLDKVKVRAEALEKAAEADNKLYLKSQLIKPKLSGFCKSLCIKISAHIFAKNRST
ncbi:MAG: hypothetical protein U9Q38_02200, partial [Thermodesulfobacteriota bacterium]|nr:hypothetical protein [Thermodesulfobacteriota bacterium]